VNVSEAGLRFIADWEGLRLVPYDDLGPGQGNCTVGVGHLIHLGPCDGRAEERPYLPSITEVRAYAILAVDVTRFEAHVNSAIAILLTQNQFDALCSFAFNLGSLLGVAPVVNTRGDVRAEMARYVHAGSAVQPGLVRRRAAEADLFERPDPDDDEEDDAMGYIWLTEKDPPPGRPYRTFYMVGGHLRLVESRGHEDMMRVFGQLVPNDGPAHVTLSQLKAIPRCPGTPEPDA